MPTVDEVRDVLAEIQDPELHRSIVELGMVRGINIADSTVTVDIALTIAGCPLKSFFQETLPEKVKHHFPEIREVTVNLGAMTEEERQQLVGGIRKEAPGPFARTDSSTTVIAIGSGKGGVGKSTVSANLAVSLSARGHSVGLIDADIWGFSIPRMLGMTSQPTFVDESMIIPPEAYGVKMISMGNFVREDNPVIYRGPMLHKYLQEFLSRFHWDEPDYLLLDLPPGTGDISISLSQFVPGTGFVVVTTPQPAAARVAERACGMAQRVNMNLLGVIENMAFAICETCGERTYPFGSGGGRELADRFDVPMLGQVPLDPPMRDFADHGKPSVISLPQSPSALAFSEIADRLVEVAPVRPRAKQRKNLPLIVR